MSEPIPSTITWRYGTNPWVPTRDLVGKARARVIVDNDFDGDPDDLFQLAHQLLAASVDVRGVIVSRLRQDEGWPSQGPSVISGRAKVDELLSTMGVEGVTVVNGEEADFASHPGLTPAAEAIIAEAAREEDTPLFVVAGGSLSEVARALHASPETAEKIILVWIGGGEHPGLATPPASAADMEYNLGLDVAAAQYVFNDSAVRIWQVPRDAYRSVIVSMSTLRRRLRDCGATGAFLLRAITSVQGLLSDMGVAPGETYVLGDQPLVLLTALTTTFEPDTASSQFVLRPTPTIADDGTYRHREEARVMRIYTQIDARLLLDDMFDSLAELASWQDAQRHV